MVDPMLSLAFSVHSNKGVFALLLGSGVSRASGIPTGWEGAGQALRTGYGRRNVSREGGLQRNG
jgi:hypothetical protein